eukprot:3909822-Pleurochrysis_carterae.AAC.1
MEAAAAFDPSLVTLAPHTWITCDRCDKWRRLGRFVKFLGGRCAGKRHRYFCTAICVKASARDVRDQ